MNCSWSRATIPLLKTICCKAVEVERAPRVLLLSGNNDSQQFLSKALQVQGYSVVQSAPEKTSMTLTDLSFV